MCFTSTVEMSLTSAGPKFRVTPGVPYIGMTPGRRTPQVDASLSTPRFPTLYKCRRSVIRACWALHYDSHFNLPERPHRTASPSIALSNVASSNVTSSNSQSRTALSRSSRRVLATEGPCGSLSSNARRASLNAAIVQHGGLNMASSTQRALHGGLNATNSTRRLDPVPGLRPGALDVSARGRIRVATSHSLCAVRSIEVETPIFANFALVRRCALGHREGTFACVLGVSSECVTI